MAFAMAYHSLRMGYFTSPSGQLTAAESTSNNYANEDNYTRAFIRDYLPKLLPYTRVIHKLLALHLAPTVCRNTVALGHFPSHAIHPLSAALN